MPFSISIFSIILQRLNSHLQSTIPRLISTDKTSRVTEFHPLDAWNLLQLLIPKPKPFFIEKLSAHEGTLLNWNCLNTKVVTASISAVEKHKFDFNSVQVFFDVSKVLLPRAETFKFNNFTAAVNTESILNGCFDNLSSWKPGLCKVFDLVDELVADIFDCLFEQLIDFLERKLFLFWD